MLQLKNKQKKILKYNNTRLFFVILVPYDFITFENLTDITKYDYNEAKSPIPDTSFNRVYYINN